MFINMLPIRVSVSPSAALISWLQCLQEQEANLRQYEYSSLPQVHEWSEVPRGERLFESIVVVQNYPLDESLRERGESLKISAVRADIRMNNPLSLIADTDPEFSLRIIYDRRRFEHATVKRMLSHLQTLLESIVENPSRSLAELPLLAGEEQRRLLAQWESTAADTGPHICIHHLFEAQVERSPQATAVIFDEQQLSYQQLNSQANRLAHYLRARGVEQETQVGICLRNSLEIITGLLGILKAGASYVLLDPVVGKERLESLLHAGEISLILTEQKLLELLMQSDAPIICLDTESAAIAEEDDTNPVAQVSGDNLAFVTYARDAEQVLEGAQNVHSAAVSALRATSERMRLAE